MFPGQPHTVAALLDAEHSAKIETIWAQLQTCLEVKPRFTTPVPHLSFHVAAGYDEERLAERLRNIAAAHAPLRVRTAGLGIFTGEQPFLVVLVVRTEELSALHRALYLAVHELAEQPSPYYAPEIWMPHLTLNPGFLDETQLAHAVAWLSAEPFDWELVIDHVALICDTCGAQGIHYRFALGGNAHTDYPATSNQ